MSGMAARERGFFERNLQKRYGRSFSFKRSPCVKKKRRPPSTNVCDAQTFVEGGRRFFLTHGDLLNEKDLPYRFWRFLSKNPLSRAAIPLIPKKAGNRFVWKVEARLYRSNFKHKQRLPVEMIRDFARRRFAEGV